MKHLTSNVFARIQMVASNNPRKIALQSPGRSPQTYGGLERSVEGTLIQLSKFGITSETRIGVLLPNCAEMATACLAIMATSVCVPLNPAYPEAALAQLLKRFGVRILVTDRDGRQRFATLAQRLDIELVELVVDPDKPAGDFSLLIDTAQLSQVAVPPLAAHEDIALLLHTSGVRHQRLMDRLT